MPKYVLNVTGSLYFTISTVDVGMLPATPSDLIVTVVSGTRLDLRWTANGTSENYFILERAPAGTTSWAEIVRPSHGVTTYSDTGLTPGNGYLYRIKAHNSEGDSGYSSTATGTTSGVAPTAPSGLIVTAINDTLIRIDWTDNSDNEASFIIERSPNGTDTWTAFTAQPANAITFDDDTVSASTTYYYRVKARNVVGDSAYTAIVSTTTPPTASAPAAPSSLSASAVSASRIDFSFTDNASNEVSFQVQVSTDGESTWVPKAALGANVTSGSLTSLASSTEHAVRVRAINAAGTSSWSNTATATTDAAADLAAPTNLTIVANRGTSFTAGWDDNTGGVARTQISVFVVADSAWYDDYYGSAAPGVTTRSAAELLENSAHKVRVRAIDGVGGVGAWSDVLDFYTSPVQPRSVQIAGKSPRRVIVTWLNVSLAETGYEVRWSLTGQNTWSSDTVAANEIVYIIEGLTPSETYDIQVRALGSHSNDSSWTDIVNAALPAETTPAAPTNVALVALTPTRLDAHWIRASTNEDYFEVEVAPDVAGSPGSWSAVGSTWPEQLAEPIPGLTAETLYWGRVRAVNDAGSSAWVVSAAAVATLAVNASPTGWMPRLQWTAERQAIWDQMKADYDATPAGTTLAIRLYKELKRGADATGTGSAFTSDAGSSTCFMYQITGDPAYAAVAIPNLLAQVNSLELYGDNCRENFLEVLTMFDWLYPELSIFQRKTLINRFKELAQAELDNWRPQDSDQVTGATMGGAAFMALSACVLDDPTCGDYLDHALIGGLDATGTDLTTARNAVKTYVATLSAGGEWCESTEYNVGTVGLLCMLYNGVKTATGVDHFPEITAELPNLARVLMIQLMPNLSPAIQWGDNQEIGSPHWVYRLPSLGMLAGLNVGTDEGEWALKMYHEKAALEGYSFIGDRYTVTRALYMLDPYATETDWRSDLLSHYASGQGTLYVHDGWATNDSLFFTRYEKRSPFVDHAMHAWGGFQLWRKGEWGITNPIGYGANQEVGEWFSLNAMGVGGLSWFSGYRQIVGHEIVEGSYAYIAGDTHGKYYGLSEPQFCNEAARSIVYLPGTSKAVDTIVVFDRVDAVAPLSLSTSGQINSFYYPREAGWILNSPFGAEGVKQWVINAPVEPTIAGSVLTWDTPGGQHVRVKSLLPASITATTYDTALFLTHGDFDPSQRKWQARIKPATDQQWDTFLNVVQVHDGSAPTTPTLIQSSAGQTYQGTLIARSGDNDTVVMFGARANAGNRLITTGTTFSWTQATAIAIVLMCDLDPAKTWTYTLDGGGSTSLTLSANGVATLTVATATAHTLVLTGV